MEEQEVPNADSTIDEPDDTLVHIPVVRNQPKNPRVIAPVIGASDDAPDDTLVDFGIDPNDVGALTEEFVNVNDGG